MCEECTTGMRVEAERHVRRLLIQVSHDNGLGHGGSNGIKGGGQMLNAF